MKRILYICCDPGIPYWGTKGASIHVREFTRILADADHDVTVVTARRGKKVAGQKPPIELITLARANAEFFTPDPADAAGLKTLRHEARQFAEYGETERLVDELLTTRSYDVVCERYSLMSVAVCDAARRHGVPYMLEVNAPLVVEAKQHRGLVLQPLAEAIERHVFTNADRVVVVSHAINEYIRNVAPSARVEVIPNGVDLARFTFDSESSPSTVELERAGEGLKVGFVGSLKPWHGIENLLAAFERVIGNSDSRSAQLVIVGDGPLRDQLGEHVRRNRLESSVTLTGAVPHDEIPGLLATLDVVVAPYPAEGTSYFSPLKVYEYMAAGRAIIASRVGQLVDLLDDEITALFTPPDDIESLANAIVRLRDDRELRERLGRCAREIAHRKHGWTARVNEWERIFDEIGRTVPAEEVAG